MKKIISCIICLLIISLAFPTFGASTSYTVGPGNIKVSIPDDMYVFTRDTLPEDERFAALGFGYDTMMATFNEQSIYLQAISNEPGNQKEIVIISKDTGDKEYSDITALYNAAMAEGNALEKEGKTVIAEDIFESGGTDYVMVEYSEVFTSREYITVKGGQKIIIRLTDYEGDITADEEESFEAIIKTVSFPKEKKESAPPKKEAEVKEEIPDETENVNASETSEKENGKMNDKLIKILITIAIVLLLTTIPAFIIKLFLFRRGLSRGGAKAFSTIYSIAICALILYLGSKKLLGNIPMYIALIPILWSFVIYKMVKH